MSAALLVQDSRAAWAFYRAVRQWALQIKPNQSALWHETTPDEQWDITLVSERVYGRRDEHLVVMAVAGMDTVDQALPVGLRLAFPHEQALYALKRRTGFESRDEHRDGGLPAWL